MLAKFTADAPTTTMQRLKGLMTVRTPSISGQVHCTQQILTAGIAVRFLADSKQDDAAGWFANLY